MWLSILAERARAQTGRPLAAKAPPLCPRRRRCWRRATCGKTICTWPHTPSAAHGPRRCATRCPRAGHRRAVPACRSSVCRSRWTASSRNSTSPVRRTHRSNPPDLPSSCRSWRARPAAYFRADAWRVVALVLWRRRRLPRGHVRAHREDDRLLPAPPARVATRARARPLFLREARALTWDTLQLSMVRSDTHAGPTPQRLERAMWRSMRGEQNARIKTRGTKGS